ncbi:DUF6262 family protein [Streptomyces sp. HC307]|uniref:DUF6262 family protein n=1 Tax=Streptomyces flavusporus TaxID=3385496 RepID=UPI0039174B17
MNPNGNPTPLAQARRRDSIAKRLRVLTAIERLERDGEPITHTAVARTAGVSTWLTYAEGVREHIHAAQARQNSGPTTSHPRGPLSPAALRTDLELARREITTLREERDRLRTRVPCMIEICPVVRDDPELGWVSCFGQGVRSRLSTERDRLILAGQEWFRSG